MCCLAAHLPSIIRWSHAVESTTHHMTALSHHLTLIHTVAVRIIITVPGSIYMKKSGDVWIRIDGQETSFSSSLSKSVSKSISRSICALHVHSHIRTLTYLICVAAVIVNEHTESSEVDFILVTISVTSVAFVQYVQIACRKRSS